MNLAETDVSTESPPRAGRRGAFLAGCVGPAAAVAVVMIAGPFFDTPFNDDFSYYWTARRLAEEGRFAYNGFATAMVGVQALWAALVIKAFGFSFATVRLGMLPLAAGSAWLVHALGRRAGLSPRLAAFGSMTLVCGPVFIPLADSFMTDVTGLFFQLAAIYAITRMVEALEDGASIGWLAAAAVLGVAGGTVRQIVWVVPVFLVPLAGWLKRGRRRVVIASAVAWALSVAAIIGGLAWQRAQPYTVPEAFPSVETLKRVRAAIWPFVGLSLTLLLMALPVAVGTLAAWRPPAGRRSPAVVGLFLAIAVLGPIAAWRVLALPPWLGDVVTTSGILGYPDWPAVGSKPTVLKWPVRLLLGTVFSATMGYLALGAARSVDGLLEKARGAGLSAGPMLLDGLRPYFPPAVVLLLAFDLLILPLLVPRAINGMLFDRYGISLVTPILLMLLIRQERASSRGVSWAGWACLAVFAAYGVAATHDRASQLVGQKRMLERLVESGIPRPEILAGFEFDGWYQIEADGYVNDPALKNPPGAYRPDGAGPRIPELASIGYYRHSDHFPAIRPRYFVATSPRFPLVEAGLPRVAYRCWLPPFEREILGLRWDGDRPPAR